MLLVVEEAAAASADCLIMLQHTVIQTDRRGIYCQKVTPGELSTPDLDFFFRLPKWLHWAEVSIPLCYITISIGHVLGLFNINLKSLPQMPLVYSVSVYSWLCRNLSLQLPSTQRWILVRNAISFMVLLQRRVMVRDWEAAVSGPGAHLQSSRSKQEEGKGSREAVFH